MPFESIVNGLLQSIFVFERLRVRVAVARAVAVVAVVSSTAPVPEGGIVAVTVMGPSVSLVMTIASSPNSPAV